MSPQLEAQGAKLGLVDLGSNTARLVVFEYQPRLWYQMVDSIREPVRLAEGFADTGTLSGPAMDRAIAALELFADYADAAGLPPIHVYCTSAVREATNRDEFLTRITGLGLSYSVVSGEQEARHGVRAVVNSLPVEDAWVIDLGGGSAQISRVEGRRFVDGSAYPLGAVRTTERFLAPNINAEGVAALERFAGEQLESVLDRMRDDDAPLVAVGGSVRSLASVAQASDRYPYPLLHAYEFSRPDLENVTERLLSTSLARRRRIAGVIPDRADILPAAAIVFRTLMRAGGHKNLTISGTGVREGIFLQTFLPTPHRLGDLQEFAISNLRRQAGPSAHPQRVRDLALSLFDGLRPLHGLGSAERRLLAAAAELHDLGTRVSFHRRHRQAAYLINAAPLWGFDHAQQAMISQLVRFHRAGQPRLGPYRRLFQRPDSETALEQLEACLRLAVQFERSRAGRISRLSVTVADPVVVLVEGETTPTVELWEARKHSLLFRSAFGRDLDLAGRTPG